MLPGAKAYLNHTAAYAIAYALLIGVEELIIFGCDYIAASKPYGQANSPRNEPARYMACSAYWCGLAEAQGMSVMVTPNSALLDSDTKAKFYGYLIQPVVHREETQTKPTLVNSEDKDQAHG